mmetsp:Transcript_28204/g.40398  ORF Transcript_28204/g.40398 Transcript_28204/m.40398 type:complete len:109 (+) Transcript_28204:110-436(+)
MPSQRMQIAILLLLTLANLCIFQNSVEGRLSAVASTKNEVDSSEKDDFFSANSRGNLFQENTITRALKGGKGKGGKGKGGKGKGYGSYPSKGKGKGGKGYHHYHHFGW